MALMDIVNVDLYPLTQQDTPAYKTLVQRLHEELISNGIVLLPNFMTQEAIQDTLQSIKQSTIVPYHREVSHNVYLQDFIEDAISADDHPKTFRVRSCKTCYTHDQIDPRTTLNTLFTCDEMTEFIRCVLGKEKLYRTVDALGALNVHKYNDSDELGWHFDRGEFVVTLLLQLPESGGEFEFYPSLRSAVFRILY